MKYEIKCPNCGQTFEVDENKYNQLLDHIKEEVIEKEVNNRLNNIKLENQLALNKLSNELNDKHKDEIAKLQKENDRLNNLNDNLELKLKSQYEIKVNDLNNQIKSLTEESKHKLSEAILKKENEIDTLKNQLALQDNEFDKERKDLKERYQQSLKDKDEQIAQLKDYKLRLSTKMVGESLEIHCMNEFNKIRPMFGSNNIYFEKDNLNVDGSKGDFIYKETTDDGVEVLSIMFEMKNENETTATKHKNEDFFKELDKDRNNKNCEYAILVTMLESDSEYYNSGIVDVSYRYPKMYVIRPQFFIPIITLLRNAAIKNVNDKIELERIKNANIDITKFEDKLEDFKTGFNKHYDSYEKHSEKVIKYIDDTIAKLNNVKDEILTAGNQLRLANNSLMDVTIKKLTYGNKTMQQKFKELKEEKQDE